MQYKISKVWQGKVQVQRYTVKYNHWTDTAQLTNLSAYGSPVVVTIEDADGLKQGDGEQAYSTINYVEGRDIDMFEVLQHVGLQQIFIMAKTRWEMGNAVREQNRQLRMARSDNIAGSLR